MKKQDIYLTIVFITCLCIVTIWTLNTNSFVIELFDNRILRRSLYKLSHVGLNGTTNRNKSIEMMVSAFKKNETSKEIEYQNRSQNEIHTSWTRMSMFSPKKTQNKLVVVVLSARTDFEMRSVIRQTWANNHDNVFFVLGKPCFIPEKYRKPYTCTMQRDYTQQSSIKWNISVQKSQDIIIEENNKFHDIIYADTVDVYRHLPQKLKAAYHWVVENTKAEWILKVDIDCVVRVGSIEKYLMSKLNSHEFGIVAAGFNRNSVVGRSGKWAEYSEFTDSRYPPWPNGAGHAVSRPIAEYVTKHRDTLFNAQGEDVALGIWIHNAPFQKSVQWVNSEKFIPHSGNCKDTNALVIGHQISSLAMKHCFYFMDEANFDGSQLQKNAIVKNNIQITKQDTIMRSGYDTSPIVIEKYRLVLFTIPKAACTVIKQLARRLAGKQDWKIGNDKIPHDPLINGLTYLSSLDTEKATMIMTSPNWTRAIFVRDPHVRVLSSYLDKAVKHDYVKQKCHVSPKTFSDFLALVPRCKDPHWQTQKSFVDDKWWPFMNFIGHVETAQYDMQRLLRGLSIWEKYGAHGWGSNNSTIFSQNYLPSRATGSQDKTFGYYTEDLWDKVSKIYSEDLAFSREFCTAETTSIQNVGNGVFQTFSNEIPKTNGGDEFYIIDQKKNTYAVTDLHNGSYQISCYGLMYLNVTLQYTCGHGSFPPPLKKNWRYGGAKNRTFLWKTKCNTPISVLINNQTHDCQIPSSLPIVAIGDSLMRQFVMRDTGISRGNVKYGQIQTHLNTNAVHSRFLHLAHNLVQTKNKIVIIMNSGVWDILMHHVDFNFDDHRKALFLLLQLIQNSFPNAYVLWKGMTAMHVHKVQCRDDTCRERIKYMSSSRALSLETLQRSIVAQFQNICYVPQYDITYSNIDKLRTNDGRHYRDSLNEEMWNALFKNID